LKTLLLNNTSDYHNGCKKVIEAIDHIYGFDDSIKTFDKTNLDELDYSKYDRVILNGEGTIHHNSVRAQQYLSALFFAQRAGCETFIINTVWQRMKNDYDHVLKKCDLIAVREEYSQTELKEKHGVDSIVYPDLSYIVDVPLEEYEYEEIYEGQYINLTQDKVIGNYPRIDIFKQEWNEVVNRLRNADLLITGRHHEMYAACKAKCPFLVYEGNTWKNSGLLASAGVQIPFDIEGVLIGKYDEQYEKLWAYLEESTHSRQRSFMEKVLKN
jgi:polysaccharide pyruvyl transferase WcaK-like protein